MAFPSGAWEREEHSPSSQAGAREREERLVFPQPRREMGVNPGQLLFHRAIKNLSFLGRLGQGFRDPVRGPELEAGELAHFRQSHPGMEALEPRRLGRLQDKNTFGANEPGDPAGALAGAQARGEAGAVITSTRGTNPRGS
jgi:hypothetical protein